MKRLSLVFGLTLGFAFIEFLGAYFSHSLSLASDAAHMMGDVLGVGLAWSFAAFARHQPISARKRAEARGAYTNGLLLVVVALSFIALSSWRFFSQHEVETGIVLMVAGGGLAVNVLSLVLLHKEQKNSLNTRGAYRHILSDALSSFVVVVGAFVISWTGRMIIDPVLGILIALFVLWSAWGLIWESRKALTKKSRFPHRVLSEATLHAKK